MRPSEDRPARVSIHIGDVFASSLPAEVQTVLGSCVAACLFDPEAKIGGMNHFMLPDGRSDAEVPARYGVHAMELLINEIMRLGGDRRRLRAKVFGGADLLGFRSTIGSGNASFVRRFLAMENIPVLSERLGGNSPVAVRFHTSTARALVKPVRDGSLSQLREKEEKYRSRLERKLARPAPEEVTLF